ncbi:MAG: hypothetical protein J2P20_05650 [Pseudonocardia sp.]|nr:hypothetical protein [Pseudonocardia sp.]MBO0873296.1 hypothetical protein [Pseudonocardia sp.]
MASSSAPAVSRLRPALTRRDRALLAAVAAGRCHLSPGPLPSLLIDRRGACDQLAAYQLLASGLIRPGAGRDGELVAAELTPAGEAAARRAGEDG